MCVCAIAAQLEPLSWNSCPSQTAGPAHLCLFMLSIASPSAHHSRMAGLCLNQQRLLLVGLPLPSAPLPELTSSLCPLCCGHLPAAAPGPLMGVTSRLVPGTRRLQCTACS